MLKKILMYAAATLVLVPGLGFSQTSPATSEPQTAPTSSEALYAALPPSALYEEIMRPFDATRADLNNWSQIEVDALTEVIKNAHAACARLEQTPREGEELYQLARICALGQAWPSTFSAATRYLRDDHAEHLVQGYSLAIQADMNMKDLPNVIEQLKEMSQRLPYSEATNGVYEYALMIVQFPQPSTAITIEQIRQAQLMDAVRGKNATLHPGTAEAEVWQYLSLLRFNESPETQIHDLQAELDKAIAARQQPLLPIDAYAVAVARQRYNAIGEVLPSFVVTDNTDPRKYKLVTPTAANLYMIFPSNCASCARIPEELADFGKGLNQLARAWILVDNSSSTSTTLHAQKEHPSQEAPSLLQRSLYTSTPILQTLGGDGIPFYVITDKENRIRFLATGTEAWLKPDGNHDILAQTLMERVINRHDETPPSSSKGSQSQ